jgi:hypothetical protein
VTYEKIESSKKKKKENNKIETRQRKSEKEMREGVELQYRIMRLGFVRSIQPPSRTHSKPDTLPKHFIDIIIMFCI